MSNNDRSKQAPLQILGTTIRPGERASIEVPVPSLYTHTRLEMPVQVIHGRKPGPTLFISAAIHGDEINGVEIIRRVMHQRGIDRLRGTLIAIPVVNIFGFINQSRYLPDRRDLNRSFPGSESGSLAGRLANLFLTEIVARCTHGIDLHTGAVHRENFPHIRAVLDDDETKRMASAFIPPVILNTQIVEGSLRQEAESAGVSVIVYEAGEALRFNEVAIRAGVRGVDSVMREIGMLPKKKPRKSDPVPVVATDSSWIRAPHSGILRVIKPLGARVTKNEVLGIISDPFGDSEHKAVAQFGGIIIGRTNLPLVNEGEALFHIARFESTSAAYSQIEEFQAEMDPLSDSGSVSEPAIT